MTTSARGRIDVPQPDKQFRGFTAVEDLTFSVEPGRITGFLGPNGAGKTTTLRMLLHLISPTSGTALIEEQHYQDLDRPLETVGAALEATGFHPGRSGRDHLRVLAATHGLPDGRVDELLELTGIPAFAKRRAGAYSKGMRQRLGLAQALLGEPRLLLLDEPANGLDPEGIRWMRGFLRYLADDQGKTVLVSSHLLGEVEQTVEDVVIIANGRLVTSGHIEDLRGEPTSFVRTSDAAALARALADAGVTSTPEGDGGLVVASRPAPDRRHRPARGRAGLGAEHAPGRTRGVVLRADRGHEPEPGRCGMSGAIKAELRKYFSTRMWWGMAIGVALSAAIFAVLFGFVYTAGISPEDMEASGMGSGSDAQIANSVYTGGISVAYLLMLTIGVMQIGSEYRHKTITSTFLAVPRRARAMLAKIIAVSLIGAMYAALSMAVAVLAGAIVLNVRGFDPFPSGDVFRTIALALLVLAVWGLIGLGVGILIPNQVAALLIGVGVAWIVEPLLALGLRLWDFGAEYISPYLPSSATQAALDAVVSPASTASRGGPALSRWSRGPRCSPGSAPGAW